MMTSNWTLDGKEYEGETDIKEVYGFVYKITNLTNDKFYIGCKLLWKPKYKMVNKKKKKSMVESDWRKYWSSSESLQADVLELGEENFKREILELVKYKGMLKYVESKMIFANECLERDDCYNSFVGCKIHRRAVRR